MLYAANHAPHIFMLVSDLQIQTYRNVSWFPGFGKLQTQILNRDPRNWVGERT